MKQINFETLHFNRKRFVYNNKNNDHEIINGSNNILISAPHGVSQVRLGKLKFREIGSLTTALALQSYTNSYLIAKTSNNNDDANFDEASPYKDSINSLIESNTIDYIIDFHGLSSKHNYDINLGTHLGKNIENNTHIYDKLIRTLVENNFSVSIDSPFMAGSRTISGSMKNKHPNLWTIQIEINCAITNKKENFNKYKLLLNILTEWINSIGKKEMNE